MKTVEFKLKNQATATSSFRLAGWEGLGSAVEWQAAETRASWDRQTDIEEEQVTWRKGRDAAK